MLYRSLASLIRRRIRLSPLSRLSRLFLRDMLRIWCLTFLAHWPLSVVFRWSGRLYVVKGKGSAWIQNHEYLYKGGTPYHSSVSTGLRRLRYFRGIEAAAQLFQCQTVDSTLLTSSVTSYFIQIMWFEASESSETKPRTSRERLIKEY